MKDCPKCGFVMDARDTECPRCHERPGQAAAIPMATPSPAAPPAGTALCPACNHPLPSSLARLCPACRQVLTPGGAATATTGRAPASSAGTRPPASGNPAAASRSAAPAVSPWLTLGIGGSLSVIVLLAYYFFLSTSGAFNPPTPNATVKPPAAPNAATQGSSRK